ncbi:unnamed protein product [Bursaphelenchus xylophilus]|uniref:(pine wood nematode) hypothetical protein n=1 Tax=Bursaphelenchus xylophilus TaxID=6326 RepID=A0A1I7RL79_BURXY|nr:unnamed protein product [Bursaphelenchus xylophilus]CAG9083335.1 unnamed protein product [Bursaphelenchus xylophilus]
MTIKRKQSEMPKEEHHDPAVFKVLQYKLSGSDVERQIFIKKDPSDASSLVLGSIPFFLTTDKIQEIFESLGSKKTVSDVSKRGDHPDQGYTSAKVTFLTERAATSVYTKAEEIETVIVSQPEGFGMAKFVEEYNSGRTGFADDLQRARTIAQAHQEHLVTRKAEAKNKKSKPDEEGWVTVTSKDRHVFKSPKLAGIKKKKGKGSKSEQNKSIQLL